MSAKKTALVPSERIEHPILLVRGHKMMLDSDLADLYAVETKQLVQAVKRNLDRFPDDFMFQLSSAEFEILRSQSVTSSWGGRRYPPYAFTEQGVAMLRSQRAVQVNIEIMRAFVKLRAVLASHQELRQKLVNLEHKGRSPVQDRLRCHQAAHGATDEGDQAHRLLTPAGAGRAGRHRRRTLHGA